MQNVRPELFSFKADACLHQTLTDQGFPRDHMAQAIAGHGVGNAACRAQGGLKKRKRPPTQARPLRNPVKIRPVFRPRRQFVRTDFEPLQGTCPLPRRDSRLPWEGAIRSAPPRKTAERQDAATGLRLGRSQSKACLELKPCRCRRFAVPDTSMRATGHARMDVPWAGVRRSALAVAAQQSCDLALRTLAGSRRAVGRRTSRLIRRSGFVGLVEVEAVGGHRTRGARRACRARRIAARR